MIISPQRNLIFVHIPKTGGTSLALAWEARAHKDDILIGDTPKARRRKHRWHGAAARGRLWKHATLADIEGLVSSEFIAGAFHVTMVRNPWDRIVSLYHWLRAQRFAHPMVARARSMAFADFLRAPETQAALRTQSYDSYMRDGTGQQQRALYIRLEAFDADSLPLWAHLGFRLDLPRANCSARNADYRGYYDTPLVDLVGRICAGDVARHGYRFDG